MKFNGLINKSLALIEKVINILGQYPDTKPTLRQIYYRLVASQQIKNSKSSYNALSRILVKAREGGLINPESFEDRVRRLDGVIEPWDTPHQYMEAVKSWCYDSAKRYHRDIWGTQDKYVEVWTEKDALSSLLSKACIPYRVPVAVCRGYNSLTFLYETVKRLTKNSQEREAIILYFGDFDPSGEDMVRDIRERLSYYFGLWSDISLLPAIEKVALSINDIYKYDLPPDFAKTSDTRAKNFIEKKWRYLSRA